MGDWRGYPRTLVPGQDAVVTAEFYGAAVHLVDAVEKFNSEPTEVNWQRVMQACSGFRDIEARG